MLKYNLPGYFSKAKTFFQSSTLVPRHDNAHKQSANEKQTSAPVFGALAPVIALFPFVLLDRRLDDYRDRFRFHR